MDSLLFHDLVHSPGCMRPDAARIALREGQRSLSFGALAEQVASLAGGFLRLGLARRDRVAVYLPKTLECVTSALATTAAGGIFVPVNPVLKPAQVTHILNDSGARFLVTSPDRVGALKDTLDGLASPPQVILSEPNPNSQHPDLVTLATLAEDAGGPALPRVIDADIAAILYTSGSTGRPKGVVLSHRNLTVGAASVASYLAIDAHDRLLAVLPLAFDYGLNQITTALRMNAEAILMDYLLPREVIKVAARHAVTGLAGVPPLWNQLAHLEWPDEAVDNLRYITNSGGAMPQATLGNLRERLHRTKVYLMYGLTEAFRSTYLPPEQIDQRPTSMGQAIPSAEILVVRPDGSECAPNEPGELVHRGVLVAQGYWNDAERTQARFRPAPNALPGLPNPELAVWSGDTVYRDEDGYLYFVARDDAMIKSSGYRISPEELEDAVYATGTVAMCAALGKPDPALGQKIVLVLKPGPGFDADALRRTLRQTLPGYMVPHEMIPLDDLPHNPNGKIDRSALKARYGQADENA